MALINSCSISFSTSRLHSLHIKKFHPEEFKQTKKFFSCEICGQLFSRKNNLTRHQQNCICSKPKKLKKVHTCQICLNKFQYKRNLSRHSQMAHPLVKNINYIINESESESKLPLSILRTKCGNFHRKDVTFCENCKRKENFSMIQIGGGNKIKRKEKKTRCRFFHCHCCVNIFPTKSELYEHHMTHHSQLGTGVLQSVPWNGEENSPWYNDGNIDRELQHTYEMHSPIILQPHIITPVISLYNSPVYALTIANLVQQITLYIQK